MLKGSAGYAEDASLGGGGSTSTGFLPRMGAQLPANEGLKRPSDSRFMRASNNHERSEQPAFPTSSRRPNKQIKGFAEQMQGPGDSAVLEAYAEGDEHEEHGDAGLGEQTDRQGEEDRDHAAAANGHEGGNGQQDPPDQAANPELTDVVAAGIIAMASRRSVLLEKIDMLTEAGVQCIDQLKENFRAEMSRLRAQIQEGTDSQEQAWRQVSNETRAAEERLRCARALVECLNAQGLGAM